MEKVRIGIAGCGWISENGHLPALKMLCQAEAVSAFDPDISRIERFKSVHGIKEVFADFDDFIHSDIDAVIIATPNYLHMDYAAKAIKNGKHVLIEKPLTIYPQEAKALMALGAQTDRIVMPGFVNRFRGDVLKTQEWLKQNQIGQINRIEADWVRKSGIPRPGTWFTNKELSGGGVLIDLGSHIVDICLMAAGKSKLKDLNLKTLYTSGMEGTSLQASWFGSDYQVERVLNVENSAECSVLFENQVELDIRLSWSAPVEGDYTRFRIYGEEGTIELKSLFGFSNERLFEKDSLRLENYREGRRFYTCADENPTSMAFKRMHEYFADSIINGNEPSHVSIEDGVRTVELINRLYTSETIISDNSSIN